MEACSRASQECPASPWRSATGQRGVERRLAVLLDGEAAGCPGDQDESVITGAGGRVHPSEGRQQGLGVSVSVPGRYAVLVREDPALAYRAAAQRLVDLSDDVSAERSYDAVADALADMRIA